MKYTVTTQSSISHPIQQNMFYVSGTMLLNSHMQIAGVRLVGWLGFNGTFNTE